MLALVISEGGAALAVGVSLLNKDSVIDGYGSTVKMGVVGEGFEDVDVSLGEGLFSVTGVIVGISVA